MAGCRFAVGRLACGLVLSSAVWLLNFVNEPGVNSIYADLAHPSALVVRTSAFFGPEDDYNFVTVALRALAEGRRFAAARDSVVSPTYVPDLACVCLDLLIDGERGLWHLSNQGALTWAELARRAASLAGLDADLVEARPSSCLGLIAARPRFSALASERGLLLPPLESALQRYVRERAAPPFTHSPRARA